ncbi:hypothetical protein GCM10027343_38720 [Noviherbaspirillum agri]
MTRPDDLFEAASYDLNKFRERRMAERRAVPRNTADRRNGSNGSNVSNTNSSSGSQTPMQSPPTDSEGTGPRH